MKEFLAWFRPSLEGSDGKASGRMLTGFHLVCLITIVVFAIIAFVWCVLFKAIAVTDGILKAAEFLITVLELLLGSVLLIYGVVTMGNIMALKASRGLPDVTSVTNIQTDKTIVNQPPEK